MLLLLQFFIYATMLFSSMALVGHYVSGGCLIYAIGVYVI